MNNNTDIKDNFPIGRDALEYIDSLLTPEEIAESNLRVALLGEIIQAKIKKGVSTIERNPCGDSFN
jgi:hypothetical protein